MFWRKRSDGFEWHKYVRTTIKLRREDRRRRIDEAKIAAIDSLHDAGRAGIAAGRAGVAVGKAGVAAASSGVSSLLGRILEGGRLAAVATGRGLGAAARATYDAAVASAPVIRDGVREGAYQFASGAAWLGRLLAASAAALWRACLIGTSVLARILRPAAHPLMRPGVQMVLTLIGGIALLSAVAGLLASGLHSEVAIAGAVAVIALLLAALPILVGEQAPPPALELVGLWTADVVDRTPPPVRLAIVAIAAIAAGAYGIWTVLGGRSQLASLPGLYGLGGQVVEGRAQPLSGDALRIGNTVVRLSGIEAPDPNQRCSRPGNRRWRCGEAAQEALARAVRSGNVRCVIGGRDEGGRATGTCYARDMDIATNLVREGHVFSSGGLISSYDGAERQARSDKAGVWQGEAERPSEYRAKLWEAAKRTAPDECPIKGQVSSGGKYYVLPWSPNYERVQVRVTRGERWFCTEREAQAAGWKPVERS